MSNHGGASNELLARLEALATRVEQLESELARPRTGAGPAPMAASLAAPAAVTGRRGALRRLLLAAGAASVGALAAAREADPAQASFEGTHVPFNNPNLGIAGYPNSVTDSAANPNAVAGILGLIGPAAGLSPFGSSGVLGVAAGSSRVGVQGLAATAAGVYGRSIDDAGVYGESNTNVGVAGRANSAAYPGVRGLNVSTNGTGVGVSGYSSSPTGTGVLGTGNAAGVGVLGTTTPSGTSGTGVRGESGTGTGVRGQSDTGNGVHGTSAGNFTAGLLGQGTGGNAHGVTGTSVNAFGLSGTSTNSKGFVGVNTNGNDFAGLFVGNGANPNNNNAPGIYVKGSLVVTGSKNAAVKTSKGLALLHAVESPDPVFEDFGRAKLQGGKARVELDPLFAETIETRDYHVFLTPHADTRGLFVASRDARGFTVQEAQGGTGSYELDWRVVGKRKDLPPGQRLKKIEAPNLERVADLVKLAERPPEPPGPRPERPADGEAGPGQPPSPRRR